MSQPPAATTDVDLLRPGRDFDAVVIGASAGAHEALRREAIERFRQHIERWLDTSQKRLYDGNPFPRLGAMIRAEEPAASQAAVLPEDETDTEARVLSWPADRVVNG